MKAEIFTSSISSEAGGVKDAVKDLFQSPIFHQQNIELHITSYHDSKSEEERKEWEPLSLSLYNKEPFFLYSKEAKDNLLHSNADLLHIQGLWRYPHAFMATWKQKKNKPIICTPHGMLDSYIIENQGIVKRFLGNILFAHKGFQAVDVFHALCYKELEDIRAYGLKQPVAIIPNGINFPNPNKKYESMDSKKHLLYLGRLHPKKGIDLLLQAIANIKKTTPSLLENWIIDIVGWDHENCKAKLEEIVQRNSLQNLIRFHGGLFGEDKIRMYANASAYILPSHGEGLPMSILEAWSWKLPVIMTTKCNIPEGFEANAAIKIEDNIPSTQEALGALLKMNDEQRLEMGKRGYQLVAKDFTWDESAKKMIKLYEWLVYQKEKPDFIYEST